MTDETAPHGRLEIVRWTLDHAPEMGEYWSRNREHLAPTQPHREESFWTVPGQRARIERVSSDVEAERLMPFLVVEAGRMVGEVIVSDVARGAFCSGRLGYSIDAGRLRRGIATWAVSAVVDAAFAAGLHRLQAATLLDNEASQGVLARCGFEVIGVARQYLAIAGSWRDHRLWQRVDETQPAP